MFSVVLLFDLLPFETVGNRRGISCVARFLQFPKSSRGTTRRCLGVVAFSVVLL